MRLRHSLDGEGMMEKRGEGPRFVEWNTVGRKRRDRGHCGRGGILAQVGLLLSLLTLAAILVSFLTARSPPNPTVTGALQSLGMEATRRILARFSITPFPSLEMERGRNHPRSLRQMVSSSFKKKPSSPACEMVSS
ncbi:hypothetical protein MUK42_26797 [Musa troglodytarum]|uniref:Uncharacterized protein n=1 Tax=Musa troglodytarum TaxID=320322 RepID=A0A9E7K1Q8_9LILI|nr:hypothetical protein MUK42_26797 [Musa troglodytarum]